MHRQAKSIEAGEARGEEYARIARAIEYLDTRREEQPSLEAVAAHVGLSPFHFQRLFRRWAGVSPKRFLQALTAESAKAALRGGASVLDAALESGLSGPGRLHDLLVSFEAMTPGEVRRGGAGLEIRHGFCVTPFGEALLGRTERGLCALAFVADGDRASALEELRARWPKARFRPDPGALEALAAQIFDSAAAGSARIPLLVRGTNFQVRVWQALLRVPPGARTSYGELATAIGKPGAARAIGTAVGANPIAYLIPCHRVIRRTGALGGYRWGTGRKRALLAWESALSAAS